MPVQLRVRKRKSQSFAITASSPELRPMEKLYGREYDVFKCIEYIDDLRLILIGLTESIPTADLLRFALQVRLLADKT
jgi:hypothetical protein